MSKRVDYSRLTERRCSVCCAVKPISAFGKYKDGKAPLGWRYYSRCVECGRIECRAYGAGAKPKRNARLRAWRKKNPAKARLLDRRKALARYGLDEAAVEDMRALQGGKCLICRRSAKLVIDHCHETGRVRGLICSPCNTHVGWIESVPGFHQRVETYLAASDYADVLLELANA